MEHLEFDDNLFDDRLIDGKVDVPAIKDAILHILQAVGENAERDGLKRTPERVARMYAELLSGYHADPNAVVNDAIFEVKYDEMVIVRDVEFYSLCEHHLLPFMGRCPRGLYSRRKSTWPFQNPSNCGPICPTVAGPRAHDASDCRPNP